MCEEMKEKAKRRKNIKQHCQRDWSLNKRRLERVDRGEKDHRKEDVGKKLAQGFEQVICKRI